MESKINQNRWQSLFYLIVALANGNFSYQIQRTGSDDELEAMVALCNMLVEELKETFRHHGFIDPRRSYRYIAKMMFILDAKHQIVYLNKEVPQLLHFQESFLLGKDFEEILENDSLPVWANLKLRLIKADFGRYTIKLHFRTNRALSLSAFCYLSRLLGPTDQAFYSIVSFQPVLLEEASKEESDLPAHVEGAVSLYSRTPVLRKDSDLRLVQEVRDFILKNLGEPIPNIRDLAHHFGTNESKLKEEFRKIFTITPFQFYNRERMNLAKELILNTPLPLQSIADMTGFKTYPHFSYAFKKEFGMAPFQYRNPLKK